MFFHLIALSILEDTLTFTGKSGPGSGLNVVMLAGDEEYRSEEGLPQLARILSEQFGYRCTVTFSLNKAGEIDPDEHHNQPGLEALEKADLCVMLLRFREWPDEQMAHFDRYVRSGKPILALRTSTHAFDYADDSKSAYRGYGWRSQTWPGGFGKQVLGENWVSHWGDHGRQATRGFPVAKHPVVLGVTTVFGTTDVYEVAPPKEATILVRAHVLQGMQRDDLPASGRKKDASGLERAINDPAMPLVWTRDVAIHGGKTTRVVTCTMGAATDLLDLGVRRLLVNSVLWLTGCGQSIDPQVDILLVGDYKPTSFGFGGFKKGVKPSDLSKNP